MNEWIKEGVNHFYTRRFAEALKNFSLALSFDPASKEARIGAMLSDMAMENEEQALALFEYYLLTKESGVENCENAIENIIRSLDQNQEKIAHLLKNPDELESKINAENGIKYEDFMRLVGVRGDFKKVFEDIMFSTKVIISRKEDFVDFLEKLLEHGFVDISLNYLETAVSFFPNDKQLLLLIKKITNRGLV